MLNSMEMGLSVAFFCNQKPCATMTYRKIAREFYKYHLPSGLKRSFLFLSLNILREIPQTPLSLHVNSLDWKCTMG